MAFPTPHDGHKRNAGISEAKTKSELSIRPNVVREILECTPAASYVALNWFFLLSSSSGQGIAPPAPEMPEMERYEVSDAQPWCFFYQRPKTRPWRSRRRRPLDQKSIGRQGERGQHLHRHAARCPIAFWSRGFLRRNLLSRVLGL